MSKYKMISPAVPNVPWQDKPENHEGAPLWRYTENPVIGRNPVEGVARIFNSAVIPYEGKFIGVFRGEQVNGIPFIYLGRSEDGLHWTFDKEKINFVNEKGESFMPKYAYDPRKSRRYLLCDLVPGFLRCIYRCCKNNRFQDFYKN